MKDIFKKIKLFVYDFDGVMTDNRFLLNSSGEEQVYLNRSDGLAIKMISSLGINQVILSSENSEIIKLRADKLKIDCMHGVLEKEKVLKKIQIKYGVEGDEVGYIGNDLNDYKAMKSIGLKMCPFDAEKRIVDCCDIVFQKKGGQGVIRELYSMITGD